MSVTFSDARGTYNPSFQLGRGGPLLKGEGGVVKARSAGDDALARVQVADPVALEDAVNRKWAQDNLTAPTGMVRTIAVTLNEGTATSATTVPQNARVLGVKVNVSVPFGPGISIQVGTLSAPDAWLPPGELEPQEPGLTIKHLLTDPLEEASAVVASIEGGTGSGVATVLVEYAVPDT